MVFSQANAELHVQLTSSANSAARGKIQAVNSKHEKAGGMKRQHCPSILTSPEVACQKFPKKTIPRNLMLSLLLLLSSRERGCCYCCCCRCYVDVVVEGTLLLLLVAVVVERACCCFRCGKELPVDVVAGKSLLIITPVPPPDMTDKKNQNHQSTSVNLIHERGIRTV